MSPPDAIRHSVHLWVDADACPVAIREILFRAAERVGARLTLIANQPLRTPPSPLIDSVQVGAGFDVADDEIVRRVSPGDLVITSDIPLASEVIDKGAAVLTPRGEEQTRENIRARLQMRDFMDTAEQWHPHRRPGQHDRCGPQAVRRCAGPLSRPLNAARGPGLR